MEKFKFFKELIKVLYAIRNAINNKKGNEGGGNLSWYDFLSAQTDKVPLFAGKEGNIVNLKELSISEKLPKGPWLYFEKSYDSLDTTKFTTYQYDDYTIAFYGDARVKYEQEINGKTYYYYQSD